ncbi:hypothetical protein Peur_045568 [Populus x canadensis]
MCLFDGCISMDSMEIERRPYRRNCNCALHKSKAGSSTSFPQPRNILFPKKQSWRDCSLSLVTYQPRVKQILAGPCYTNGSLVYKQRNRESETIKLICFYSSFCDLPALLKIKNPFFFLILQSCILQKEI